MSKDYSGFKDKMSGDVGQASMAAHNLEESKSSTRAATTKTRLRASDMPSVVPPGSQIDIESITFHKLNHGDIILCRIDRDVNLRRFLRIKMNHDKSTTLLVTREGKSPMVEIVSSNALVGRVVSGEGRSGPLALKLHNRGFAKINNKLTDFGSTTPLERVSGLFDFAKAMLRLKNKKR